MRKNKWQIPFKSGTGEYTRAFLTCRRFNKTYPELTDEERRSKPSKKIPKTPKLKPTEDSIGVLFYPIDALKLTMEKLTEEIAVLSLEIVELRIASRRAKKEQPLIS